MTARDPYEVLGLARGATLAQVKRAYRIRARQTHPDGQTSGASASAFDEVRTAYVRLLDELAMAAATATATSTSLDLTTRLHFTPRELVLGTRRRLAFPEHQRADGTLLSDAGRTLEFPFGPLTAPGSRLRWAGHGWQRGRSRGALLVEVVCSPGTGAQVRGEDLRTVQPVSMLEWLQGGSISVSAPEGHIVVQVEPRHPVGTRLRLSGRGLPKLEGGRGDLLVTLQPCWPAPGDGVWPALCLAHRHTQSSHRDLFAVTPDEEET